MAGVRGGGASGGGSAEVGVEHRELVLELVLVALIRPCPPPLLAVDAAPAAAPRAAHSAAGVVGGASLDERDADEGGGRLRE
eukprot:2456407-Rhodomonas_salina.1